MTKIKAGQHWQECDPRFETPRIVEVLSLSVDGSMVKIRRLPDRHITFPPRMAKVERFNGRRGGYRLVRDA